MIETLKRDGLSRIAEITAGKRQFAAPNIFFVETERYGAPENAEVEIALDGGDISPKDFPEVIYPLSVSSLNDVHGEGEFGTIYFRGDEIKVSHEGATIYSFPHLYELIGDARSFVDAIVRARKLIGTVPAIYLPAAGKVNHLALFSYLGIDFFDSIPLIISARDGKYLDENGDWESQNDFEELLKINYGSALRELEIIRKAIEQRRLREIVEIRARSEPWLYAALRIADEEHWRFFESYESLRPKIVRYSGPESVDRPEVRRFRERISERWKPRGDVLLLLPCSARKPYSRSRTHRKFREVLESVEGWGGVQELILTSPLILVPRELERYYPAGYYDAAVRGKWDPQEIDAIKEMLEILKRKHAFRHVIIHLPEDMDFVSEAIYGEWTAEGSVTSKKSLENLREALERALSPLPEISEKERRLWTLQAMVEFQFGIDGEKMVDSFRGRWPNIRGMKDEKQTVSFVDSKGSLSLTVEGGRILAENEKYRVFISDFEIHGDIFSTGVEDADPEIREGDDVVVIQKDEPVAVGIAERPAHEMVQAKRGIAVRIRKKIRT